MRIENRKELVNLIKAELKKRNVELTESQFQDLIKYVKQNNWVGDSRYNCEYIFIDVDVWLHKKHISLTPIDS